MERLRSIADFWSWLPAFRAVGETSHLPTASKMLGVSPSALSRSVQQLEGALGRALFRRSNRRLELTEDGQRFLDALRQAMRLVHEATLELRAETLRGTLRIYSAGVATSVWVVPAVMSLRRDHPDLVAEITSDADELIPRLLSGRLDIAFQSTRIAHPRLRTEALGNVGSGVYCGPEHPLFEAERVDLDDVLAHEFVAAPPDANGVPRDGWPPQLPPRRVALHVDHMRIGHDACLRNPLLAVLPDPVAAAAGPGRLRRLPLDVIEPTPVFATLRTSLDRRTSSEILLERVRQLVGHPLDPERPRP